ncbi:hypothetical protein [Desulfosarcina cetonica]
MAIADVYDALSSRRCYKDPWDEANSIETISQAPAPISIPNWWRSS